MAEFVVSCSLQSTGVQNMQSKLFSGLRGVSAGLLAGTAGVALLVAAPASAQSAPGALDGAYDDLDTQIADATPSEADQAAAQAVLDADTAAAADLTAAQTTVADSLTDDNTAAFAAVGTAQMGADAAQADEDAAIAASTAADATFDAAADDLTVANQLVTAANVDFDTADAGVDAAQTAFDNDQNDANLAALNTALADRATAQQAVDAAEADRGVALTAANMASDNAAAALASAAVATDASVAADAGLADTVTALDTSLGANADFVTAATAAGVTADAAGIIALDDNANAAVTQLAATQTQFDTLDDDANTFIRAQGVLVPAAENANPAIAAASQALLGDPRAVETNAEVEVIAALVDHEVRITDNTAAIVTETQARVAGDAQLLDQLTTETNARIAADTAIGSQVNALEGRVGLIETRLSDFDDRISSSTATAIALGGMAFLPDTKFNLAIAAGFYEGAQAIAANIGYRVTDNVAIIAGVGGGLNKSGKVGGRVGVIFGW